MTQQLSPWIEGAYGWDFGEGGWNTGMDSNLLKFSFLFDRNVDSVTAALPAAVNGQAHYLTTDNRLYFAVGTTYFSTSVPKWFTVIVRSSGDTYQYNGSSLVQVDSPTELDSRLDAVELTVSNLGTAAFEDVGFFATQADLDIVEAQAADYTDALRNDIADVSTPNKGTGQIGRSGQVVGSITALRALDKTATSKHALVTGYYAQGDGGGGGYWLDVADVSSADNGSTIIVATDGGRWKLHALDRLTARQGGAAGSGSGDDRAELAALAAQFGLGGGQLFLGQGDYVASADAGSVLRLTTPVLLAGELASQTSINPSLAATTDNTLTISPNPAVAHELMRVQDLSLHNPATGQRVGLHGVFLDTQVAGQQLAKFTLRDMAVGQGNHASGWGVLHLNDPADNVNGGMYAALLQNILVKGGINLQSSGDSNSIVHSIITGTRIGVSASLAPGASLLEVQACNITTAGGAIKLDAGHRFRLLGNNIEHTAVGAAANNNSAVVNINGADGTMYGGVIKENLVSAFGATDATTLLRLRNCQGTLVEDNVFLSGAAGVTTAIDVGTDCVNTRIGANTYNAIATKVLDNGVGTMGVVKTATLLNGWVAFAASNATLQFIKSTDGIVHVFGAIKNGTITNGTIIATLPTGFRPSETVRVPIFVNNAGTAQIAEVSVDSAGDVRIGFVLANSQLNINFSFPAANLANAVSSE